MADTSIRSRVQRLATWQRAAVVFGELYMIYYVFNLMTGYIYFLSNDNDGLGKILKIYFGVTLGI